MSALSEGRLAVIARTQPNEWLPGPWFQREVEGVGGAPDCFEVHTANGTVLATLPDWAGNLALWMAEAPEVIAELLAEVNRPRSRSGPRRDLLLAKIEGLGGRWDVGRVKNLYAASSVGHVDRSNIRSDLRSLRLAGHLALHKRDGRQYYTLAGGAK